jgi:2-polyprenyl-3-methyl-5-hydroxy-6-metoxy-1,4-benzoquinol methylase
MAEEADNIFQSPEMLDPCSVNTEDRMIETYLIEYRYEFAYKLFQKGDVLDIGSGPGLGASYLQKKGGIRCFGIDHTLDAVKVSKGRYPSLSFVLGDAEELPYPSETFHAITAMELIEHVKDPQRFLSEVRRVLAYNGLIVVSTPNYKIMGDPQNHPFHLRHYKVDELISEFQSAGFAVERIEGFYWQIPHLPREILIRLHNVSWSIKFLCHIVRNTPQHAKYILLAARKVN